MPAYAAAKIEFSTDPLSVTSPTWKDVTRYCQGASWQSGKAKDLDSSQAGGATIVLRNDQRRFEPEYSAGAYYPNIRPLRRFRITVRDNSSGTSYSQGIYYATSWTVSYPAGTDYSVVTVELVDGFGILSLANLSSLSPASASSLTDVQVADGAYAVYPLNELTGTVANAATGPEGKYLGQVLLGQDRLVVGSRDTSVIFSPNLSGGGTGTDRMRAPISDAGVFSDPDAVSVECVVVATASRIYLAGPLRSGTPIFYLNGNQFDLMFNTVDTAFSLGASILDGNPHHVIATWDGTTVNAYVDGAHTLSDSSHSGSTLSAASAGSQFLYVGTPDGFSTFNQAQVQAAAFYEYALSPAQAAAHYAAARTAGRAAETVGLRIKALAANALWSTAGISSSQLVAEPLLPTGQSTLDEITRTVAAETPIGIFYFDDAGNPAYYGWDDTRLVTPAATFGDGPGEIDYTAISVVYDDELYNQATTSRDGGAIIEVDDTTSQAEFGIRSISETDLDLDAASDAARVARTIVDQFAAPMFRVESITLSGATPQSRAQILAREIGDSIRVRRLSTSSVPIDIITTILGKSKAIDVAGNLTCTWSLARGFNARSTVWRLGVNGYDELGQTTVLG